MFTRALRHMRSRTLGIALASFALLITDAARAESFVHLRVPINLGVGAPLGELSERTSPLGFAFTLSALVALGQVPFWLGGELGGVLLLADSTRRRLRDYPDIIVETTSKPRIFLPSFVARLQSPWGAVQPYVEGRLGLKVFGAASTVELQGDGAEALVVEDEFSRRATVASYGITLGIEMISPRDDAGTWRSAWGLSIHYLNGPRATFAAARVRDPAAEDTPNSFAFRTRTDMLLVMLGLSFDPF
jgi:hypothetical protein